MLVVLDVVAVLAFGRGVSVGVDMLVCWEVGIDLGLLLFSISGIRGLYVNLPLSDLSDEEPFEERGLSIIGELGSSWPSSEPEMRYSLLWALLRFS